MRSSTPSHKAVRRLRVVARDPSPIHMWQLPRPQVGWVTVLLLTCVWGCAATEKEKTRYETIEAELDADTDKAIALNKKALKFLDEADLERAEEHLQQSLVADVNYGPAHNNLGQVYFQQERYYLAAWEFEYAARLLPENPEPVNNLGLVYDTVGRRIRRRLPISLAHASNGEMMIWR